MRPIEIAVDVLGQHSTEIATVREWADKMGYVSPKYFSRLFLKHYGIRPKEMIVQHRLGKLKECMTESPDDIFYCVARKMGFVDHNAMYKFVNRHTGKSLSELKSECKQRV